MLNPVVSEILGAVGRLLSASRSGYLDAHPGHAVFFNANIFDSGAYLLWYGDIDLTTDGSLLQALADELGEDIYVTSENPYRWESPTVEVLEADIQRNSNHPRVIKVIPNEVENIECRQL